jgi:hypothetical protein
MKLQNTYYDTISIEHIFVFAGNLLAGCSFYSFFYFILFCYFVASKTKSLRRGVKEVVKAIRKGEKG